MIFCVGNIAVAVAALDLNVYTDVSVVGSNATWVFVVSTFADSSVLGYVVSDVGSILLHPHRQNANPSTKLNFLRIKSPFNF
jgi:hypothetical protein